jgi:hypothetical protein
VPARFRTFSVSRIWTCIKNSSVGTALVQLTTGSLSCIVLDNQCQETSKREKFVSEPGESRAVFRFGYNIGIGTGNAHLVNRVVVGATARAAPTTFLRAERDEMRVYMVAESKAVIVDSISQCLTRLHHELSLARSDVIISCRNERLSKCVM